MALTSQPVQLPHPAVLILLWNKLKEGHKDEVRCEKGFYICEQCLLGFNNKFHVLVSHTDFGTSIIIDVFDVDLIFNQVCIHPLPNSK